MNNSAKKEQILGCIGDLVADLLYYDRSEDEDLELGEIEELIKRGVITPEEMAQQFLNELKAAL